ncbi:MULTISPECIES: DUF6221 family protein [unclassified Streptomyces]|uniref:DUF6221 family protein n=1 Tax=unclassified Streptomyces TaxID=2593676 RepID=UPI0004C7775D|nr:MULTISPECIES: DUF6221 family protein [unclassified Streptomyces]KOV86082.1 hypothetical protein ADL02_19520 [Streptomyces sp. NRRL WC-3723]
MDELVQFLRDRLDEDEQTARAAAPGPWRQDEPERRDFVRSAGDGYVVDCSGSRTPRENAEHVARHDPARVLRDIEARRALLAEHELVPSNQGALGCAVCVATPSWGLEVVSGPCTTLRLLASVHADHPDYREEWRP